MWGASASDIYVTGNKGVMIRYDGFEWSTDTTTFKQKALNGIWGDGSSNIHIVGEACSVFRFEGKSWSHTSACSGVLSEVMGVGPRDVFVVGGTSLYWSRGAFPRGGRPPAAAATQGPCQSVEGPRRRPARGSSSPMRWT